MSTSCLVTGAAGFIGSHLVEHLVRAGWTVRALARYSSNGSWGNLHQLPPDVIDSVEVVLGDVRDSSQMAELQRDRDVVFHLAALIGIPYSYVAPRSYVEVNVTGTQNVLEGALRHGGQRVIVTSTSEVYGTAQYTPIDEDHPLHPQSPYAATKVAADQLALSYQRSFGLPVRLVRPFNTFGPRQSPRAVIPTVITQALATDQGAIELGALSPQRDLVFVEDTVRGMRLLAEASGVDGEVFNLATGRAVSIGELAERILAVMGKSDLAIRSTQERVRPEKSEVELLLGKAEKAAEHFDWRPEIDLEEGLRRAADYFAKDDTEHRLDYRV